MKKVSFLLMTMLVLSCNQLPQSTIGGKITDSDGKPFSGITMFLVKQKENKYLPDTLARENISSTGEYEIVYPESGFNLLLVARKNEVLAEIPILLKEGRTEPMQINFDIYTTISKKDSLVVRFKDENGFDHDFYIYSKFNINTIDSLNDGQTKAEEKGIVPADYWKNQKSETLIGKINNFRDNETDTLLLSFLDIIECHIKSYIGSPDTILARKILNEVKPNSILWGTYIPFFTDVIADKIMGNKDYIDDVVKGYPVTAVRVNSLWMFLIVSNDLGLSELEKIYYNELMKYDGWNEKDWAIRSFGPQRKISAGNVLPDFKFNSLNDSTVSYSKSSFRRKYYLLDFWGTWCIPCVGDIPYLIKTYTKYNEKGFEILSIACYDEIDKLKLFTTKRYPMKWKLSVLNGDSVRNILDKFEVFSYPTTILVDPDGKIIGTGSDVRREKLDQVLGKYLK